MSIRKHFKTNLSKEVDGVAMELPENDDGTPCRIYLARMSKANKAYSKELKAEVERMKMSLKTKTLSDEKGEEVFMSVFCSTVVKTWEGMQNEDGTTISFSKANAVSLFTEMPDFYAQCQEFANNMANFKDEMLEEATKN